MNMDSDKLEVMKSIVRENFEFSWGKAQEFIKQQKNFEKEKEAYEQLIAEYENYICKMEEKFEKTDRSNENDYIMLQTSIA